ncbi:hypothetical protein V8E51_006204 [Hyaloscypha variabilis]
MSPKPRGGMQKRTRSAKRPKEKGAATEIQRQWGSEEQSTLNSTPENLKIKTRGKESEPSGETAVTDATPKQEEPRITVAVTERAFSVFKSMFPGRGPRRSQQERRMGTIRAYYGRSGSWIRGATEFGRSGVRVRAK